MNLREIIEMVLPELRLKPEDQAQKILGNLIIKAYQQGYKEGLKDCKRPKKKVKEVRSEGRTLNIR